MPRARALVAGLAVSLALNACSAHVRPAPVDVGAYWPTYLGNAARSGFLEEQVATEPPGVAWSMGVGGGVRGAPVVTDDVVLAASTNENIYALSRQDGTLYWRKRLEGPPVMPLLDGDVVFTATEKDGKLRVFRIREADDVWEADFPSVSRPLSLLNGTLYAVTESGVLYALDTERQEEIWHARFRRAPLAGPLVVDRWVAYVALDSVHLLNRATGERRAAVATEAIPSGEAASDGDAIYLASEDGALISWSLPDLALRWRISGFDAFHAGPVIADRDGYAATRSGDVIWFSTIDGAARLIAHVPGAVAAPPTVVRNGLLVGTIQGRLYFFDRNGDGIWDVELNGSIEEPVVVHDGRLFASIYGATSGMLGSENYRGKVVELR